jgi:hypothetical protein
MCYSALVRQDIHELARRYGAEIAYEMFVELFRRRLDGDDIKATRALEQNFANPKSEIEQRIKADIDAYRAGQVSKWPCSRVKVCCALISSISGKSVAGKLESVGSQKEWTPDFSKLSPLGSPRRVTCSVCCSPPEVV